MEPKARYLIVGTALLVLVGLLVSSILWIAKSRDFSDADRYVIYFRKHSLSGLQEGSVVTMKGIKVGVVNSFRFSVDDVEQIRVLIEVQPDTPVRTDTMAVVSRHLLTGLAGIDLIRGSQSAPPLTETPVDENYPVIREGQGELEALRSTLPEILAESREAIARFTLLLSEENRASLSEIIQDVKEVSGRLAAPESDPAEALHELRMLIKDVRRTVNEMQKVTTQSGAALTSAARSLMEQANIASARVGRAASSVTSTAEKFKEPRRIIYGPEDANLGPGEEKR